MTSVFWTEQARTDLASIQDFISQDSPHYAAVVIARLIVHHSAQPLPAAE